MFSKKSEYYTNLYSFTAINSLIENASCEQTYYTR